MSDQNPDLDSLFEALIALESPAERRAFIEQHHGDDALRTQLERLLASDEVAGSFLEKPPAELGATIFINNSAEQRAAALEAGSASAHGNEQSLVPGSSGHSVLISLSQTMDIPSVSLREAEGDGESPIEKPRSLEIPSSSLSGRYRVDGEIARGGMGAILKGRDTDLGRDLAIKVLLDEHKHRPEMIQRFVEEAQIGGQLQHPGIAPVYELGQFADQRPFFTMKLVKGQTLAKLLAERSDSTDDRSRFIGIFEQVCQTLSYAHARGVIHRDLKPSNIMVGAFGEVQVMDWGLAKVLLSGGVADEKKQGPSTRKSAL